MRPTILLITALLLIPTISTSIAEEPAPVKPDRLYFVQFHHPGGEHEPDLPGERSWNSGSHRRKFMQAKGTYLTTPDAKPFQSDIVFWGEWEPPSLVLQTFAKPILPKLQIQ